jgi:8-oxo-dGTP pyrophosphatase MutT (NUDIX family)
VSLPSSDPRAPLLAKLAGYRAIDADDAARARRIAAFVESTPRCFERANLAGHVTGSAWLVDARGERVLLTHHRKLNLWLQLGGHADGDADALRVARREAEEESGMKNIFPVSEEIFDVDVHPIPARGDEPAHLHYDVRFALRASDDRFTVGEESHELAWVDVARLAEKTSEPSMLRMAAKWVALAREEKSATKTK